MTLHGAMRALHHALLASAAAALAAHATAAEPVVEFIVQRTDTLIALSNTVLVSPAAWREVARLNKLRNPNRIVPDQVLKIPTRLLRSRPVDAKLISVVGDVRVGDAAVIAGSAISEGQSVQTGPASSAIVELADGSRMKLPPSSLAQVIASRQYGERAPADAAAANDGWFAGTMRVLRGSAEFVATKVLRAKPLEVVTPTAVVGVRGTQYRVGLDDAADSRTHSEVIEGQVRIDAPTGAAGADLPSGFGAAIDASAKPPVVAKLLPAPDLGAVPERFERPIVRFRFADEATPLRVQVAADGAFEKLVSDQRVEPGAEVRLADLADAQWYLRARRIDVQGIEGYDSARPFTLKARPEPPAQRAPRAGGKQTVGSVEFAWAANVDSPRARLQVAEDAEFKRLVLDRDTIDAADVRSDITTPGSYYWRVASIRPDGDHGPFGDAQRFELRPMPEPANVGRSADGSTLVFQWSGRPEDRQQVQLARDPQFTQLVASDELAAPEWTQSMPSRSGRYYFRYRSVEPDGFISPYSETLLIEVPRDWKGWLLLLPVLLLL
jgi:hypothetical protein